MVANLAFYRKYRPQTFADVVAQEHITRTLHNALAENRLSHAYLLCGPRGTGKTTVARILAKALNCPVRAESKGAEPCNQCASCLAITAGSDLDVLEIDAASNRGIDEIRDLREKVRYAPVQSANKVYIIDEVHMLTNEAFNALLKTLEDPPPHCVFLFATTDPQRLPATFLSRCQRFDFHRVPAAGIFERLQHICRHEDIAAEDQALRLIARHARGGLRDAVGLLDQARSLAPDKTVQADVLVQVLGMADDEAMIELTAAALDGRIGDGLSRVETLIDQGRDPRQLLRDWVEHLRNLLILSAAPGAGSDSLIIVGENVKPLLAEQASRIPPETLLSAIEYLAERDQIIRWAPDARIVLEAAWFRFLSMVRNPGGRLANYPQAEASNPQVDPQVDPQADVSAELKQDPPPVSPAAAMDETAPSTPAPAAPEEQIAAPATASGSAAPLPARLGDVQRRWPEIQRHLGPDAGFLARYVTSAHPYELKGGQLTLAFKPEQAIVRDRLDTTEHRQMLRRALKDAFGADWNIHLVVLLDEPVPVTGIGAAEGDDGAEKPAPEGDMALGRQESPTTYDPGGGTMLDEAMAMFNAQFIDPGPLFGGHDVNERDRGGSTQ